MPRRKPDIEETLAWTIYEEMCDYTDKEQIIRTRLWTKQFIDGFISAS